VLFLVFPIETLKVIVLIVGVYFAVRGIAVTIAAPKERGSDMWALDLARGAFFVVFAAVMALLPEAVFAGFLAVLAAGAVVAGGVMLAYGIQHHNDDAASTCSFSFSVIIMVLPRTPNSNRWGHYVRPHHLHRASDRPVAIAAFGVLQDSTAVVIGAMLIAPLMTPIIGTATGAVKGWHART
jgi:hypothetical protein